VERVAAHGPGELGADVLPFRHATPLGTLEYYGLQAKAVRIHGSSAKPGNAAEIVNQATKAFKTSFVDALDNERKRIDKFAVATKRHITTEARRIIEEAAEDAGRKAVFFLDVDCLVELVGQHDLVRCGLFSDLTFLSKAALPHDPTQADGFTGRDRRSPA
jgi:hypothetical protein